MLYDILVLFHFPIFHKWTQILLAVSELGGVGAGMQIPAFLTLNPISRAWLFLTAFWFPFLTTLAGCWCYLLSQRQIKWCVAIPQPVLIAFIYPLFNLVIGGHGSVTSLTCSPKLTLRLFPPIWWGEGTTELGASSHGLVLIFSLSCQTPRDANFLICKMKGRISLHNLCPPS